MRSATFRLLLAFATVTCVVRSSVATRMVEDTIAGGKVHNNGDHVLMTGKAGIGPLIDPRRIFITFTPSGGLGNQLEYLTGAMNLSRTFKFTLVPPQIPDRLRCNESAAYDRFWNMAKLKRGVGNLSMQMPQGCHEEINIMFRHSPIPAVTGQNLSPLPYCNPDNATYVRRHEFPFRNTRFISTWNDSDPIYVPSMEGLGPEIIRRASWLANRSPERNRPYCVWLDNLRGDSLKNLEDPEQDYVFLETAANLERETKKYPTDAMLVFHARVHELMCDGRENGRGTPLAKKFSKTHVCLRNVPGPGDYKYVPVSQFARTLRKTMDETGSKSIYVTNSPYLDPDLRKNLAKELKGLGARLEEPVDVTPEDKWSLETNFAEREIAVKARAFIGEMKSTWTYSVCRKRLTLGKVGVLWTSGLETCKENGKGCKSLSHVSGDCNVGAHVVYDDKNKPSPQLSLQLNTERMEKGANTSLTSPVTAMLVRTLCMITRTSPHLNFHCN